MVINYKKVGLKIKEVRLKKRLSQETLAEKCNLSTAYISYIEQGKKSLSLKVDEYTITLHRDEEESKEME